MTDDTEPCGQEQSVDGLVECLICGRRWRSLGHHLRRGHAIGADEYRDRFGIRRGQPLTSPATRERFRTAIQATIADGRLDDHYAGNAGRASAAGDKAVAVLRRQQDAGLAVWAGHSHLAEAIIAAVVRDIEGGRKVATAVKKAGISYSAYHSALARHPHLKARHVTATVRKI